MQAANPDQQGYFNFGFFTEYGVDIRHLKQLCGIEMDICLPPKQQRFHERVFNIVYYLSINHEYIKISFEKYIANPLLVLVLIMVKEIRQYHNPGHKYIWEFERVTIAFPNDEKKILEQKTVRFKKDGKETENVKKVKYASEHFKDFVKVCKQPEYCIEEESVPFVLRVFKLEDCFFCTEKITTGDKYCICPCNAYYHEECMPKSEQVCDKCGRGIILNV